VTKKPIRLALAALAALSIGAATPAAAHASAGAAAHVSASNPFRNVAWIVSTKSLAMLGKEGLTGRQLQQLFGNRDTFLTGAADGTDGMNGASDTVTFTSYASMKSAFASGSVPRGTRAILYDNEDWPLTPVQEQKDPAKYEQLAAELVHAHHMMFVSTPATTLTDILAPGVTPHYAAYLKLHIAADAARYADVIDIQAQGSEATLSSFVPFIKAAAAQARQANRRVIVLAGLSTNPSGHKVTGADLIAAAQAVLPFVNGFWLNIPSAGTACPRCGVAQPQVAVPLLRLLLQPRF
jgi:hypothetical protein